MRSPVRRKALKIPGGAEEPLRLKTQRPKRSVRWGWGAGGSLRGEETVGEAQVRGQGHRLGKEGFRDERVLRAARAVRMERDS